MVNRKRSYTLHFLLLAALTAAALCAVNYLSMEHRARLDLTADKRFTLSEGTQRLFASLTEDVQVTYYCDEEPPSKRINLQRDVRDKLQELATSSGGRLTWTIEKISNADVANKREELEKKKVFPTQDLLTSGDDESARIRGVQGYYSSIAIKYGLAEPVVINGVVNLVDKFDEVAEHRVDTLEFDISFTIMQTRSKGTRVPLKRMVKSLKAPVAFSVYLSQQMPAANPKLGETITAALQQLAREDAANVQVKQNVIPFGRVLSDGMQAVPWAMETKVETVDPQDPARKGPKFYYAIVEMSHGERQDVVWQFENETTPEAVLQKLDDPIWELIRPRSKLGFVLPPGATGQPQQPGMPPSTPYTDAFNYIQQTFGYETVLVDLPKDQKIPRDLACLIIFEPNRMSERELYEVDRYLVGGGNVVMLYQGWEARLDLGVRREAGQLMLQKSPTEKHFEAWAKARGVEFSQDLLIDKSGSLAPYSRNPRTRGTDLAVTTIPLAASIEARDINGDSVYGRRIAGMPLPFVVALKLDDSKLEAANLQRQDIVSLKDDIYRFIPANPAFPELPLKVNLDQPAEVLNDPEATPGKEIRFHKLAQPAVVATSLRGVFAPYWTGDRKVPAWAEVPPQGDPLAGQPAPELKARTGSLVVVGSASTLNIQYLYGYTYDEATKVVIPAGSTFMRNLAEAAIFGEDLISLRVRTGVAPRVAAGYSDSKRLFWLLLCVAGAPLALLMIAAIRMLLQARRRQEYEAALAGPPATRA